MPKFKVKLEGQGPGQAWTCLCVPFDVQKEFQSRARVSVCGTINGFAYRSSIFPMGDGAHMMMVNKSMQAGAKVSAGDSVRVTMERDDKPREVAMPPDLKKALARKATVRKFFASLAPSCKKEYVDWITGAKRDETRKARIQKAVTMLAASRKRLDD
jgi:hypothetical protein